MIFQCKALSLNEYGNTIDSVIAYDEKFLFEFDVKNEYVRKYCQIGDITEIILTNGTSETGSIMDQQTSPYNLHIRVRQKMKTQSKLVARLQA